MKERTNYVDLIVPFCKHFEWIRCFPLILGRSWLTRHKPHVDWGSKDKDAILQWGPKCCNHRSANESRSLTPTGWSVGRKLSEEDSVVHADPLIHGTESVASGRMPSGDRDPNSDNVQSVNPNQSRQRRRLSVQSFYFGSDSNNPSNPSEDEYDSMNGWRKPSDAEQSWGRRLFHLHLDSDQEDRFSWCPKFGLGTSIPKILNFP